MQLLDFQFVGVAGLKARHERPDSLISTTLVFVYCLFLSIFVC